MPWNWVICACCKTTIKTGQDSSLWWIEIWGITEKHFRKLTRAKHCQSSGRSRPTTIKGDNAIAHGSTKWKLEDILLKLSSYSYNTSSLPIIILATPCNGVETSFHLYLFNIISPTKQYSVILLSYVNNNRTRITIYFSDRKSKCVLEYMRNRANWIQASSRKLNKEANVWTTRVEPTTPIDPDVRWN